MPYQTLYRAFRPQSLEEVCGQQTVTRVLSRQLETGRISHAYLFCGSRGTGKTLPLYSTPFQKSIHSPSGK